MMLENITFENTIVQKLSFEEKTYNTEIGGTLTFEITDSKNVDVDGDLVLVKRKGGGFHLMAEAKLAGWNEGDENDEAFSLKLQFLLVFSCPESEAGKIDNAFYQENGWFFDNYAMEETYKIVSPILRNTHFDRVVGVMPKGRVPVELD